MIGVFGANGFIGRHVVRHLLSKGRHVRMVSRHLDAPFAQEAAGAESVVADLGDELAMASALADVRVAVQLVSTSSPGLENRYALSDIRENIVPQVQFLQLCIAAGVERLIFLSSGGTVYGQAQTLPISESHPTRPLSSHGMTKLVTEQYIEMYGRIGGLGYTILRVANPFGPGQLFRKGQGLVPAILQRHEQGLPIRVIGQGLATRDFLYVEDLVDAITLGIDAPGAAGRILNVGSGTGRRIADVIDAVERVLGEPLRREHVPGRASDVDSNVLDISLSKAVLGWHPRTPFEDGLARTVEAFRGTANPTAGLVP